MYNLNGYEGFGIVAEKCGDKLRIIRASDKLSLMEGMILPEEKIQAVCDESGTSYAIIVPING